MRMSVVLLNEETFMQRVADFRNPHTEWKYKGDRPAIVDFYATWCGPCRVLSPVLEEIASVYKGVVDVYKVMLICANPWLTPMVSALSRQHSSYLCTENR